jgi:hypothetical protein
MPFRDTKIFSIITYRASSQSITPDKVSTQGALAAHIGDAPIIFELTIKCKIATILIFPILDPVLGGDAGGS